MRYSGSSPPARGTRELEQPFDAVHRFIPARAGNTLVVELETVRVDRFIPARAGNTCTWPANFTSASVHPRPRGEHEYRPLLLLFPDGSSPPARGTPLELVVHASPHRFIPARAGNTCKVGALPPAPPVHPRPRGEHEFATTIARVLDGSSPPARGTP